MVGCSDFRSARLGQQVLRFSISVYNRASLLRFRTEMAMKPPSLSGETSRQRRHGG